MRARRPALALLALGLLMVPGLLPLPAGAAPGPWVVEDEQVVEGRPLALATGVVVRAGGALRLRDVDALALSAPERPLAVTVEAGGLLALEQGTSLASPLAPLDVVVEAGGSLLARGASVRDVRLEVRGEARIEGGALGLAAGPLRVPAGGLASIAGAALEGSALAAQPLLRVEGGTLEVANATLRQLGGPAAVLRNGSMALQDTRVQGPQGYAFDAQGGRVVLERVRVEDAQDYGLYASEAEVAVRDSVFDTECGLFLTSGTRGEVEGNLLRVTGRGVSLEGAGAVQLARNTIAGAAEAVRVRGMVQPLAMDNNTLRDGFRGLTVAGAQVASHDDRFLGNGRGVEVLAGDPAAVVLRGATFAGNLEEGVWNGQAGPVDARWSWWGAPGGPGAPGADAASGAVEASPWLAAPP